LKQCILFTYKFKLKIVSNLIMAIIFEKSFMSNEIELKDQI
jgi:hypothetical protein